jgi:hypothetical protein
MGSFTVETERRGEISVLTSDETRYRVPGVEGAGFADIQIGDRIVAVGRFEEGSRTVFLARGIGVVASQAIEEQSQLSERRVQALGASMALVATSAA